MNATRRKNLKAIITKLEQLDSLRQEIQEQLQEVRDGEQEALENMPESLQESERGQQMQEYIDTMESADCELSYIDLEGMIDLLREICA